MLTQILIQRISSGQIQIVGNSVLLLTFLTPSVVKSCWMFQFKWHNHVQMHETVTQSPVISDTNADLPTYLNTKKLWNGPHF